MPRKPATTDDAATTSKAKAKVAAPSPKAERIEQNGIVRPRAGGKCARVWDIADSISKRTRKPAELAAVLEQTDAEGLNAGNTRVEYQRWRKFNGLGSSRAKAA
jgi:hypothetical protein